jgi:putative peptide zinc metalloprotease protein
VERYLFGLSTAVNPAGSRAETSWLVFYFVAAFIYRVVLLTGILLIVSHWFFVIGMILAVVFGFLWLVLPVLKAFRYLWSNPGIEARRGRAVTVSLAIVTAIFSVLAFLPLPSHFRSPGIVRAEPFVRVFPEMPGRVVEILVPSGSIVSGGEALLRMENFELEREIELARLELAKTVHRQREALELDPVRHQSLESYRIASLARLEKLEGEFGELVVRAPVDGRWIAPELSAHKGSVVPRGIELGMVQGEEQHYLAAEVRQADVARLFGGKIGNSGVKVRGQEHETLGVTDLRAIPADRAPAPDRRRGRRAAMGRDTGEASQNLLTTEPFFEVRAYLEPSENCYLVHGQQGVARLDLPSLRQLLQRNYRV